MTATVTITLHDGIASIDEADWDRCAAPDGVTVDPFITHRFLRALEDSGSVGEGTGWTPRPMVARKGGEVIGVAPLYIKHHSQGEYIFDHNWAHAYERAGGSYYPKAQIAVPFTPATGRRFLAAKGHEAEAIAALTQGAVQVAAENGLSSLHITFCTEAEAIAGEALGLMRRTSQQFHWENPGYQSFEDFLAALSSRKRKTIKETGRGRREFHTDGLGEFRGRIGEKGNPRRGAAAGFAPGAHDMGIVDRQADDLVHALGVELRLGAHEARQMGRRAGWRKGPRKPEDNDAPTL